MQVIYIPKGLSVDCKCLVKTDVLVSKIFSFSPCE